MTKVDPRITPLTNIAKQQELVQRLLHGDMYKVNLTSKNPFFDPKNQDYHKNSLYAVKSNGDYQVVIITPQYGQQAWQELCEARFQKYYSIFTDPELIKLNNNYFESQHYLSKQRDKLRAESQYFEQGLVLIIPDSDNMPQAKTNLLTFTHLDQQPVYIAASLVFDSTTNAAQFLQQMPVPGQISVPIGQFKQISQNMPHHTDCLVPTRFINGEYKCLLDQPDLSQNRAFSCTTNRWHYYLDSEQLQLHYQFFLNAYYSSHFNSLFDLNNPSKNPAIINRGQNYPGETPCEYYQDCPPIKNVQFEPIAFDNPHIVHHPQNFENLLKQTDPTIQLKVPLYFNSNDQQFYRISKDIYRLN